MSNNVKLERVKVEGLLNRFSYDIDLNNGYDVSVIIAPNGCGKTTIFNIITFMFRPNFRSYVEVVEAPFWRCECTLSNGEKLSLEKEFIIENDQREEIMYVDPITQERERGSVGLHTNEIIWLKIGDKEKINITYMVEDSLRQYGKAYNPIRGGMAKDIIGVDNEHWVDDNTLALISKDFSKISWKIHRLMRDKITLLLPNYIRADRLYSKEYRFMSINEVSNFSGQQQAARRTDYINEIIKDTKRIYLNITGQYDEKQRKAKNMLPKLYLEHPDAPTMDYQSFERRWKEYISKIEKYSEIGLIESDQTEIIDINDLEAAFNRKGAFLEAYLDAYEQTTEPLERAYNRLKLFVDILNSRNRITRKVMKYSKEGITVSIDGKGIPIKLETLSSGEKNDLVMFYRLIFVPGKLVLIDEPEISLHIEWQEEYLDYLLQICEMNKIQAIVATHSPNIVNGHFELYAERGLTDGNRC